MVLDCISLQCGTEHVPHPVPPINRPGFGPRVWSAMMGSITCWPLGRADDELTDERSMEHQRV